MVKKNIENDNIEIKGARVNNLKNITINIPRNKLIAITGVSGSGKSSLAFDTLYAEGQRRYIESLSSYARQFLGRMSKPECDFIKGLPPAIAIEQKVIVRNPRSTVGTSTEIYEYLRLLFARIGRTFSPISGKEVKRHTVEDVLACIQKQPAGSRFLILSPIHVPEKRTLKRHAELLSQEGYSRLWQKDKIIPIKEVTEETSPDDLWLIIDRLVVDEKGDNISRMAESIETAFYEGDGECRLLFLPDENSYDFSTKFEADGLVFEEPTDNTFSFNSPMGACPTCEGFGNIIGIDERLVIPNTSLSVYEGCVQCWHGDKMGEWKNEFCRQAKQYDFPIFKPYYELTNQEKDQLWHGLDKKKHNKSDLIPSYENIGPCIDAFFEMVRENQYKIQYRVMMSRYRGKTACPKCHGTRLKQQTQYIKVGGKNISEVVEMPVYELKEWFANLKLTPQEKKIADRLLPEIKSRIGFLVDVGLGYLTLNRPSSTLSGGESQRINLTTALGSTLVGSLYVLDEPSIGLHSRDTHRLIEVLKNLRSLGNTVVVVEHDEDIIRAADWLIDIGPDAGRLGGEVVYEGKPKISKEKLQAVSSHTISYLHGKDIIPVPASRRTWNQSLLLKGCRMNNLKGIDAEIPLNVLTVLTGVSGSGKSTLIKGILYPALKRRLNEVCDAPGEFSSLEGSWQSVKHIEFVSQSPIGKSTRSNPSTYVKAYDAIRQLFAEQPLAKQQNFTAQYFSFNAEGGRCEECKGAGVITVEMQFMADLELVCEECHGTRFKKDVLEVTFCGKNIHDILDMTVSEAITFFQSNAGNDKNNKSTKNLIQTIVTRLTPLQEVGLGYIKLGQSSSTLSGGENQRVKLAYYIGQDQSEPTLFIFDEPTTGLHFHDIQRLLKAFYALINKGHSVLVIEHNIEVIKCADHIIDLGPEGGDKGGYIVAAGTPESIAQCENSYTGKYLKEKLQQ